jgi:hypothetical protein
MGKKTVAKDFKNAVEQTEEVANCFQSGLSALGNHSSKIQVANKRDLQGSIDIDNCTRQKYPSSNRWDYAFAYAGEIFFVEVHSAQTSEVATVLKKLTWLKDWLKRSAPEINKMKAVSQTPFYWIQSKGFAIPSQSRQYRLAVTKGLKPVSKIVLK